MENKFNIKKEIEEILEKQASKWQKLKEWLKNQITDLRHIDIKTETQSLRVNDAVNCFRQVLNQIIELEGEDYINNDCHPVGYNEACQRLIFSQISIDLLLDRIDQLNLQLKDHENSDSSTMKYLNKLRDENIKLKAQKQALIMQFLKGDDKQ